MGRRCDITFIQRGPYFCRTYSHVIYILARDFFDLKTIFRSVSPKLLKATLAIFSKMMVMPDD